VTRVPVAAVAEYVRSKNAGPFRLTLDILFTARAVYEHVRDTGQVTPELVAGLYRLPVEDITDFVEFDPGKAIKVTIRRRVSSGAPADTDVYGAQQHAPLLAIQLHLPDDLAPGGSQTSEGRT
jgi:hypothetical protein